MSFIFPITDKGLWHNGAHRNGQGDVKNTFPGEVVAYKAYDEMIYPDTVPEEITPEDYESLDPDIAKDCTKGLFNALWVLPKLPQEVQEKVMRTLGLRLSSDLMLLKHEIQTGKGTSKTKSITYYSLWMHLSSAKVKENKKKSGNLQYGSTTTPICLPPNTVIGKYGTAETEDNTYQLEYFTKPSFKVEIEKNNSQKYLIIPKDSPLYTVTILAQKVVRQLAKNSILEITENADPDKHPNSMRVKIKKYSATIDIEGAKNKLKGETLTEEQKSKVDSLTINDFIAGNAYKLPEGFGNVLTALPMKTKYGKEEKAFTALPVELEKKTDAKREEVFVTKDPFNMGEIWIMTDSTKYRELHASNMIGVNEYTNLDTYDSDPSIVTAVMTAKKTTEEKKILYREVSSCRGILDTVNPAKGRRDAAGNLYYTYEGDTYVKVPTDYNEDYSDIQKYITICAESDLKDFANCTSKREIRDFFQTLYKNKGFEIAEPGEKETLGEFIERVKDIEQKCGFEHPTEWSQKRRVPPYFTYVTQYIELFKKLAIWDSNGKNKNLPKDIQNGESLTFFYPDTFETYIRNIHEGFAFDLIRVQDMVMNMWILKTGNLGIWPKSYGKNQETNEYKLPSDTQTYCNHAVWLTIKAVDANYMKFTGKSKNVFPDHKNPDNYVYKASNYWCDVLEKQAQDGKNTGVLEVTVEQAQAYANLGYVVIGAWKNKKGKNEANNSPHYVTVRPHVGGEATNDIHVAHVGTENGVLTYQSAFRGNGNIAGKKKYEEVRWYCNVKQVFQYEDAEIKELFKRSGWKK